MGLVRLALSMLVVGSHVGGLGDTPAGGAAVGGFFVLSGFLMAKTIVENYPGRGALRFYVNRLIRLGPPLVAVLALTALVLWVRDSQGFEIKQGSAHRYMPVEFPPTLAQFVELNPHGPPNLVRMQIRLVPQGWSLLVEGCFYLLSPLLVWLATRRLLAVLSMITAASFALALQSSLLPAGADWLRSPTSSLWVFTLGMLVYFANPLARIGPFAQRVARRLSLLPIVLMMPLAVGLSDLPQGAVLLGAPALVAVWLMLGQWTGRTSDGWDRTAGNYAYGVFLGHFLTTLLMFWTAEIVYGVTGRFGMFGVPDERDLTLRLSSYAFALAGGIAIYYACERPFEAIRAAVRARRRAAAPVRAAVHVGH
jgi:peptidoglycan/LPS O-acetylase OafA/YrhL